MKDKIGIIGSGQVAKVLADGFMKHGYTVMVGTRDASRLNEWKQASGNKGQVGSFAEAAEFGEIVVLAVTGRVALEALELAGGDKTLAGKTVIDVTNPIAEVAPVNGVLSYFTDMNESLMERLQQKVPSANFVKAFSSVGSAFMVNPKFDDGVPTMFICGNDDAAKAEVNYILTLFGWDTADMGKVESARAIEPLCILWCIPGFLRNEWTHAFKLISM